MPPPGPVCVGVDEAPDVASSMEPVASGEALCNLAAPHPPPLGTYLDPLPSVAPVLLSLFFRGLSRCHCVWEGRGWWWEGLHGMLFQSGRFRRFAEGGGGAAGCARFRVPPQVSGPSPGPRSGSALPLALVLALALVAALALVLPPA